MWPIRHQDLLKTRSAGTSTIGREIVMYCTSRLKSTSPPPPPKSCQKANHLPRPLGFFWPLISSGRCFFIQEVKKNPDHLTQQQINSFSCYLYLSFPLLPPLLPPPKRLHLKSLPRPLIWYVSTTSIAAGYNSRKFSHPVLGVCSSVLSSKVSARESTAALLKAMFPLLVHVQVHVHVMESGCCATGSTKK